MKPVAHIYNDFTTKFGVPRQSGLSPSSTGRIVFAPEYRNVEAFRGLEGYSHIWLLWDFSESHRPEGQWSPTVRPPRLGGNVRMGVWATRSPFRPNPIGLSSVKLERIELQTPDGPVLIVSGADLMNGTPILDIKPYLPFTDVHLDATGGFAEDMNQKVAPYSVVIPEALSRVFSPLQVCALREVLSHDPRPHYQNDASRVYTMEYAGHEVHFKVEVTTVTVVGLD